MQSAGGGEFLQITLPQLGQGRVVPSASQCAAGPGGALLSARERSRRMPRPAPACPGAAGGRGAELSGSRGGAVLRYGAGTGTGTAPPAGLRPRGAARGQRLPRVRPRWGRPWPIKCLHRGVSSRAEPSPSRAVSCPAVPYCAVPCRAVSCLAVPFRAVSCPAVPFCAVPCRAQPCRTALCCGSASPLTAGRRGLPCAAAQGGSAGVCSAVRRRRGRARLGTAPEVCWQKLFPLLAKSSGSPQRNTPLPKMSGCRKRCKREIMKFAQYLLRLITGSLHTGNDCFSL